MADLQFNIKASFEEVAKARQELQRLRAELQNTTKATDAAKRQDLSEQYNEQAAKVRDLTASIQRYSVVMSKDFAKGMQRLTREVYSFELQADASQRKIEKLSSEIGKMQAKLRKGGLDAGTQSVLNTNIGESSKALTDEKARYESLVGLGKQARTELQNMQAEYARYSGSSTAATDNVKLMTDAFSNMISEMKKVPTVGEGATSLFNHLSGDAKQLAMSLVGGLGFEQLAEHIFNVRSQFQQLEISFNTMLGSEQKAGALMSQLIDTAAKTPFDMASVTQGAKQLLAYGTAANEVNDILIHLGDISAGLSVPLGDLVYLYGTTMAQGRMYTMDLRQFMGRGIPMAEELGKIMGKTTQEVQQAVTDGKVGADLVKKAIVNMTAEGGKFGGLMEKQSKTLQGQWSNIGDSVDQMFNALGKKSEGIFGTGLEMISTMVDNWETLVKVIGVAVTTIGVYKASLMAAASIQKAQNQATLDNISSNLDSQIQAYKDQAELYHSYNGKDTKEYKDKRLSDLQGAVANTDLIGNDKAEELVSLKIKEAEADGIITKEMAEQLQLKRDLLVAQQQSAAKEQQEVVELSKGLDEKMAQYKEMENDYRHLNGKDTKNYKANRYNELSSVLSDTENIGDEGTEKMVSDQIKLAQSEGLISEEMAKQLQLKRDLLVEQSKLAEKEQLQWQNAVNAKEQAAEELRIKKEEEAEIARINALAAQKKAEEELTQKIAEANKTKYGQALLETHELEKQVDLLTESKDKAMDDALAKKQALVAIDEQVKKQQELLDQKEKEIVYDNGAVDTTSFGGYDDYFASNENTAIAEYEAEKVKLDELMQKRQQASDEFEQAYNKRRSIQDELESATDKLTEAQEREIEIYKETGAEADEIQGIVEQGIAIKEGDTTITEAATTANQANTTSENANSTAKNVNAGATARQTTVNAVNTASETANTTATNVNTASENVNTSAKERNSFVTSVLSVGNKGLAVAQNVLTWATNAVTTSLKGLWAAMLANPITTVLTLVTTAISVFSMFGSEEEDAAKKTEDMGNKAAEASNKVRSLFSVLSTGKAEDHKDAINELKAAYEEYGIQLDETKMKSKDTGEQLNELKSHEEELVGLIEKRSVEMERANQLQQAYDTYNSKNEEAFNTFKEDSGLSGIDAGQVRNLVSQDDLEKLSSLKELMKENSNDLQTWNKLKAEERNLQSELNAKLVIYLTNQGKSQSEIENVIGHFQKYTDAVADNTSELNQSKEETNNAADAAERANRAMSKLSYKQEENALKTRYSKKSFKELNSEIQDTINKCSKNYFFTVKVNYDDSELPAWIKGMSNAQLKRSIAARKNWLDSNPKKGSVLKIGGHVETIEQATNTLAMLQARGTNVENAPKKTQKELDKEKKAREKAAAAAEKAKNLAETQAGNRRKATEDYSNTISSYSEKAEEDFLNKRIKLIDDSYTKEREEIWANYNKEKKTIEDGIDKLVEARKKEEQTLWVNSGKNRKANMWKQDKTDEQYREEVLNETMKDSKGNVIKDGRGNAKTIRSSVKEREDALGEQLGKDLKGVEVKRMQSMYDYLKEFGTIQEQRYAIAKEYDEKIALESDKWKKKQLESEKQSALSGMDAKAMAQDINWSASFKGVGNVLKGLAKDTLTKVDTYMKSDDFKKLPASDKKAYQDLRQSLFQESDQASNPFKTSTWAQIEKDVKAYQESVKKVQEESDKHSKAIKEMEEAEKKYKKYASKENTQKYEDAKAKVESTGQSLTAAKEEKDQAESDLTDSTTKAANGLQNFQTALGNITSGTLTGFASGIGKVITAIAGDGNKLGNALQGLGSKVGGLVGAILQIIDVLGDDPSAFIDQILDKVANVIEAVISQLPQIVTSVVKGVGNIVGSIGKGIVNVFTGGLLNGNEKEVAKTTEELKDSNDRLAYSIDKLKDSIDKSSGMNAVKNYDKAYEAQKEINANSMKILQAQMSSHGKHHSNNYYWNLSDEDYAAINKTLARQSGVRGGYVNSTLNSVSSLEDIYKLTPEQMADIRTYNQDVWKNMLDQGKYDKSEYWENYTEMADKLEELTDQINQNLTQTSFDSMKQDFISNLMDMKKSAKEFSNDFTTMLTQSMLNYALGDLMDEKLKPLYEKWANKMKNGQLSTTDLGNLKKEYADITEEGIKIRDNIADITGYKQSYEQSASSGAFESMSQDTGEELNGRFTAVQIATEGTYQVVQSIDQKLSQMLGLDSSSKEIVGATKEEPQPKKEETTKVDDKVTKTISDKLSKKMDDLVNDSLNFKGSTLGMIDSINKHRLLSGKHSLEYASGMSTEDLASYINSKRTDKFNTELASYLQSTNQQVVTETPSTRSDSLLTADISLISQNVGNIYVAVDEGRTILAQSMMYLQSIDERQESWHKPFMQLCSDVNRMKDKVERI